MSEKKLVTCPESAHLEEIAYVEDSDGDVVAVLSCTRFDPPHGVPCDQRCAQLMNERRRRAAEADGADATDSAGATG